MDPEMKATTAAEASEIEVTISAAKEEVPEIGGTSGAEGRKTSSLDSIFHAPAHIRYSRESDFEPKLVSIGPYYHGGQNLKHMEDLKVQCMSDLLKLRSVRGSNYVDCLPVDSFMKFESRARSFYKDKFDQISDVKFVEMLVLDSCFIIRIFLSLYRKIPVSMGFLEVNIKDVRSDLLLLENQIPLFFINVVYCWLLENAPKFTPLKDVLQWFIFLDIPWRPSESCNDFESDHLLDLYWKNSVPRKKQLIEKIKYRGDHTIDNEETSWTLLIRRYVPKLVANATELHQIAGVKFEIDHNHQGLDFEFSKGIIRMQNLKIDSTLETLLLNLIAFESFMLPSIRTISTYIKFMDDLIDSEKDVELLQKFGVIYNALSSHTKAATFFNDIGSLCLIDDDYENPFSHLFRDVEKYYKSSWNRRWASLHQNYFSSPWAGISVFAGVVLLLLSAVQTHYAVFPNN